MSTDYYGHPQQPVNTNEAQVLLNKTLIDPTITVNGSDVDLTALSGGAAAGALTGATLAANVHASSLTSVGTLAALTVTAPIAGSVTGLAATATALATPRAINGQNFDGTAAITVAAAAGTLTGATLAAGVTASSLTSVGTLASLAVSGLLATNRDGIAAATTDGIVMANATAASAGVTVQQSPRLRFRSNVWNSTGGGTNNTDDWFIESVPQTAASPVGALYFKSSLNGAGYTTGMVLSSSGSLTITGNELTLPAGGNITFPGRGYITGGATDGIWMFRDAATTHGFALDAHNADAVMRVRTRDQASYASVDALGYSVSGAAGASKGAGAVTSITVVNGIVTAIS